jgi:hypothetical protein
MSANTSIYSGSDLCNELRVGEVCFRSKEYTEGEVRELFHEHLPKYRISEDNAMSAARALLAKYRSLSDTDILRSHLNKRGQNPHAVTLGTVHVDYPEPGVLRKCLSYRDKWIIFDQVISPDKFRNDDKRSAHCDGAT